MIAIDAGTVRCFTDADCRAELVRVAAYPEFKLDAEAQQALLARYDQLSSRCDAEEEENFPLPRCRDADDQKFLILAARSGAGLLVTRDKLLLRLAQHKRTPPPCPIVKADEACRRLGLG